MQMRPIILIPARLASTRLPDKPLAEIGDSPMIVQVWRRAMESKLGEVVVACDSPAIAWEIEKVGGKAVLTDPDLPSGSDRIWAALQECDPEGTYNIVINLQGDLPTINPDVLQRLLPPFEREEVDIVTLAAEIEDEAERTNPNVVKPVIAFETSSQGKALYFTRATAPHGEGALFHHIGVYAYRREVLREFVASPPSALEQREKLEQLRALENGMHIEVCIVDTVPLGVDTQDDLDKARKALT